MPSLNPLQDFLDSDELPEEALDYMATHGYLTALSICPDKVPEAEWISALFAEPPRYQSTLQQEQIEGLLRALYAQISRVLANEESIELPCALNLGTEPDNSDLRAWCIGFMEGVFLREAVWFAKTEDETGQLLLPIMALSGLFAEQAEFAELAADPNILLDMAEQLPEVLTTLFLVLNSPEE